MVLASMYPSSLAFPCDEHPCAGGLDEPNLASEAQFDDDTLGGVRGLPHCGTVAVAITTCVEVAECGTHNKMVIYPIRLSWVSGSGREPDHQNCNIKLASAVSGSKNLSLAPKSGSGFSSQCRHIPHAQPSPRFNEQGIRFPLRGEAMSGAPRSSGGKGPCQKFGSTLC